MSAIGRNVRLARKLRGLTQQELAAGAHTTQHTISAIERGQRDPHPTTLRKLAEALGVEVADFFREEEAAYKEWTEVATIDQLPELQGELERVRGELAEFDRIHDTADFEVVGSEIPPTTTESIRIRKDRGELERRRMWLIRAIRQLKPPAATITRYSPELGRRPLVRWYIPEEERGAWREKLATELPEGYDEDEAEEAHGAEAVAVEVLT